MAIVSEASPLHCYDIKSADLSLVALLLKTSDIALVSQALSQQLSENPGFFDNDPLVIDVSGLSDDLKASSLDLANLLKILRVHGLVPIAIKGAQSNLLAVALGMGLVDASDARIRRSMPVAEPSAVPPSTVDLRPLGAMVIDKPLRSGQQVYAKGCDLVVLAMVNPGAEVIADGSIHIYGTLRGKAIAGARGNINAMIFAQSMAPELISIAGVYQTSENPLSSEVLGLPAQVFLQSDADGDKLLIKPLKP
ncbi:septum site-determining protein MinC [Limnohabitans sp. Jir72]|uniref:septum site-determining protein MinC n=1 Tax=Limnohabitans sp. Jir72 TaxID=1977909 RepID=UPI000D3CB45A|nr:septum site-determining protein MinC [Limnohabitans sp. Jir72]PUE33481.1 septum site-determining protein MinC [Limnohabitans sp. Jir72]